MFDDIPQKNPALPQNLPSEPLDMFAGVEGEDAGGSGGPPSALGAGILKKKLTGAGGLPISEPSSFAEPMLYPAKAPVLGKILMVIVILVIAGGVGYGAWWVYSSYIMKAPQAKAPVTEQTTPVEQPRDEVPIEQPTTTEDGEFPTMQVTSTESSTTTPPPAEEIPGALVDSDKDGLDDAREEQMKTDPLNQDSDKDGLTDGDEVLIWKTDPTNKDSDGDGYLDGEEANHGYNPLGPGKLFDNPAPAGTTTPTTTTEPTSSIPI